VQPARILGAFALSVLLGLFGLLGTARANPMLLVDMDTLEVLFSQEAGQPWHPASLTKLMTAYVAFEQIQAGRFTLDSPVVLSAKAVAEAPSKSGLPKDSALSMKDALYVMVVKSANDVAMAIAETVGGDEAGFVELMNDAARRMGLTATHFENPNGLHDPLQVTSARDLAVLSLYIRQNFPQYMDMFGTEFVQLGNQQLESQNALLATFAGTTGMKTGFVCASGLNMVATVERNGRKFLAVVLGASSARERNERAAELVLGGFNGSVRGSGTQLLALANITAPPVDMRANICGKDAVAYVKAQEAAFPMGMKDQPSYLTDTVTPNTYVATNLGRVRAGVLLPRPRPPHVAQFPVATTAVPETAALSADLRPSLGNGVVIPYPRPRPPGR